MSGTVMPDNKVTTIQIQVDTSEIDRAIEKLAELHAQRMLVGGMSNEIPVGILGAAAASGLLCSARSFSRRDLFRPMAGLWRR